MNKSLKEYFFKIANEILRRKPDFVKSTIEDFYDLQVQKINKEIKKAKRIKRIENF